MHQADRDTCAACIRQYVRDTVPDAIAWQQAWACSEQYKHSRRTARGAGDSTAYSPPYSLADVQAHLPEKGVLLDFFVDDSVLFVFSISAASIGGQVLNPESNWRETLAAFRAALRAGVGSADYSQAAYALYAQWFHPRLPVPVLVQNPLAAALAKATPVPLLIIPDRSLVDVPFDLALTSRGDSLAGDLAALPYLGSRYDIRYGLSATSLLEKSSGSADDTGFLAGVAAILILLIALAAYWQGRGKGFRRFARRSRSGSPPDP